MFVVRYWSVHCIVQGRKGSSGHAKRAVDTDDLPIDVRVLNNGLHQAGVVIGATQPAGEGDSGP